MSFVLDASAGTHVTIIGFGSEAKRYSPLVDISSTEKKQRLLASLPNPEDMGGSTSIPSKGIRKALGTFRKAARTYQIVVVITASEETTAPYIKDTKLLSKVDKQKAVVYGIAIGAQATGDDLMALCTQSKGTMFYESETVLYSCCRTLHMYRQYTNRIICLHRWVSPIRLWRLLLESRKTLTEASCMNSTWGSSPCPITRGGLNTSPLIRLLDWTQSSTLAGWNQAQLTKMPWISPWSHPVVQPLFPTAGNMHTAVPSTCHSTTSQVKLR